VQIVPTDTGIDQQRRIQEGRSIRGLGEQAAVDLLGLYLLVNPDAQALLLFDDTDIERQRVIVHERISFISTGDFLRELEAARLIQSTDYILDEATAGPQYRTAAPRPRKFHHSPAVPRAVDTAASIICRAVRPPPTAKNPRAPRARM
jgi:hypothetical protein